MKISSPTSPQAGFTLVELAIVIVLIGLIVAGILFGQDMVKAAELRAAVGQFEKLDTVVNVFRGKYNGIPGDVQNPANYGMIVPNTGSLLGNQALNATNPGEFNEEPAAFFAHLKTANLISEGIAPTSAQLHAGAIVTNFVTYTPSSKLGRGAHLFVMSSSGNNYYLIDNATLSTNGVVTYGNSAIAPILAYSMDSKLDDGAPLTGKVQAVDDEATLATATANAGPLVGRCVNTTPNPAQYQASTETIANTGACTLRVRASF
jgi:prepilin-type N-terminal cleavage/methylation domain-containing protein